ncbi:MAG: hypothetical protein ROZ00_02925 [Denitratisoma sp.]|nr:hypothetical protein [Denitratisoma sp.]
MNTEKIKVRVTQFPDIIEVTVKAPKNIEFDLLNNAKDSLRQAIELIATKEIGSDHARLKHSITASAHCIELLLKERLRQVSPAFVWENVDKYPSLEARTVTVDTAISRLRSIGNVQFSANDERNLKSLRTTRNAIEHYEWRASEKEAKIIIGHALSFAIDFAHGELQVNLSDEFKSEGIWTMLLNELWEFAKAHGARLEARLRAKGDYPTRCDKCDEHTVPMRGGSCELCGHWQAIEE